MSDKDKEVDDILNELKNRNAENADEVADDVSDSQEEAQAEETPEAETPEAETEPAEETSAEEAEAPEAETVEEASAEETEAEVEETEPAEEASVEETEAEVEEEPPEVEDEAEKAETNAEAETPEAETETEGADKAEANAEEAEAGESAPEVDAEEEAPETDAEGEGGEGEPNFKIVEKPSGVDEIEGELPVASLNGATSSLGDVEFSDDEYSEIAVGDDDGGKKKKIIIAIVAVVAVIIIGVLLYFFVFATEEEVTTTTTTTETTTEATTVAEVTATNPLTGESGYDESALSLRPIAVVVENSEAARPQYNMDTADIVIEGEVEGGITRMLWLYANMNDLPDLVGPVRSARPSYVIFSEFFDSIFVHYGGSHSTGSYTGAYDVISSDDVDDIDGMTVSSCFERTSDKVSPHNAALLGDSLVSAIEDAGYRTELDEDSFSYLNFYEEKQDISSDSCSAITVQISTYTDSHTWTYDEEEQVYSNQNDFGTEVSFTNIIVMYVSTSYITTSSTTTYVNYSYTSGTGIYASNGTVMNIEWSVDDDILTFTDEDGNELYLNPGKSWIGLASSNYSGSASVTE